ncbi:MAG TPA: histidine phosphatase family protein [Usitatibacteraceae bacterium]
MRTTLVLIRHGETEWNRQARIQGHTDSALTPEGVAQAEAGARRLGREKFDHLVASDLGRTRHTAEILNAPIGLPVSLDAGLRERCFGIGEGRSYAELDAEYPELFSRVRETDPHYAIPGAETRAEFHQRTTAALQAIAADHAGKRVLVVTHGGVLGAVYRWLNDLPIASPHLIDIPNLGYNRIRVSADRWQIETWGDISHLRDYRGAMTAEGV